MKYLKYIVLLCFALTFAGVKAQTVEQRIDSLQMLIGEQTILHLKATAPQGAKVVMPSFKPQQQITPGVEVVDQSQEQTQEVGGGRIEVTRQYILTSFDERVYAIPALNVKINGKDYHGNQLALKVLTVKVDTIHPNQFYPPKDVQDNPFMWSEWSPMFWLSILMLIICIALLYLRNRLKNNKPIITRIKIIRRVPAHEKALSEINEIKNHQVVNQESQKEYYTHLTNTLREYIVSRFGFNAMEMTSGEIIERLNAAGDPTMISELRELFQTADLVKFAKYETHINENDANLVNAIHFIDQTKTDEKPVDEKVVPTMSEQDKKSQQQRRIVKLLIAVGIVVVILLLAYIIYSIAMLVM